MNAFEDVFVTIVVSSLSSESLHLICYKPQHNKFNKMTCASSEDSDQSGHPPIPIRVFAVRMKKHWVLSYQMSAQRSLIRLGDAGRTFCWFCHAAAHMSY